MKADSQSALQFISCRTISVVGLRLLLYCGLPSHECRGKPSSFTTSPGRALLCARCGRRSCCDRRVHLSRTWITARNISKKVMGFLAPTYSWISEASEAQRCRVHPCGSHVPRNLKGRCLPTRICPKYAECSSNQWAHVDSSALAQCVGREAQYYGDDYMASADAAQDGIDCDELAASVALSLQKSAKSALSGCSALDCASRQEDRHLR